MLTTLAGSQQPSTFTLCCTHHLECSHYFLLKPNCASLIAILSSIYYHIILVLFYTHRLHFFPQLPQLALSPKLPSDPNKQIILALVSSKSTLPHCSQKKQTCKQTRLHIPSCVKVSHTEENSWLLGNCLPIFRELRNPTLFVWFYHTFLPKKVFFFFLS